MKIATITNTITNTTILSNRLSLTSKHLSDGYKDSKRLAPK